MLNPAQTDRWFTLAELAALDLPGIPNTRRGLAMQADREEWNHEAAEGRLWRRRQGRGGGIEYWIGVLPSFTQAKLLAKEAAQNPAPARDTALRQLSDEAAWQAYDRAAEKHKKSAAKRVAVLAAVETLVAHGQPRTVAIMEVAATHDVSRTAIYAWAALVDGVPRAHWLARLVPQYVGAKGPRAACADDAWEWLRARYLLPNRPTFEACWRDLQQVAAQKGWRLPSARTLRRRIDALPATVVAWHREGPDATDRMFPAQRRDRSMLHALQWVNADGHKFDVFVKWPDGTVARPMAVFFQDLYSGKLLTYRVAQAETGDTFRLAFSDVVEKYGIPGAVTIDNTLAGVVIENLPYQELIPRYDRSETLFYLDPPYWGCEGVYGAELFSRDEFTRLADLLRGIRGRFILSLNDHPGVRQCFAGCDMEVVETTYAMGYRTGKETQRVRELLISNTGK